MIILLISIFALSFFLFIFYTKISVKFRLIDQPNDLSIHKNSIPTGAGIIFLITLYFFVFIIYIISLFILIINIKISVEFINCSVIFLLISLFRGNFVHNLNFVIKLYLLVLFIQWLIKILRQLKLKVA